MRELNEQYEPVEVRNTFLRQTSHIGAILLVLGVIALSTVYALNWAPVTFPNNAIFVVEDGLTVGEIGEMLESEGLIRSDFFFKLLVRSSYPDLSIQAGEYQFDAPLSTLGIIDTLKHGANRSTDAALTFPEGFSLHDMHEYTNGKFTAEEFAAYIEYEGYLFPNTYFVGKNESVSELIGRMRREYEVKIAPYRERITASGFSEKEIITLASILEREANDIESMGLVSGILHKRLEENHALQVDATFEYILGKTSSELTADDLAIDSPYNTYTNLGLPPTPIANPGLVALEAALSPVDSSYFFYLTGDNGNFYYARTFEEHKQNKELYLR